MEFNFKEHYILENTAVKLRPLEISDINFLLEYSENEPEIWKYNANGASGKDNLERYIETAIQNRTHEKDYPFIVFDKNENKYVGSTRFYDIKLQNKTIDIGYTWYRKKSQQTAINKNSKYLMLEFAFENLQMERVGFTANTENKHSIHAMQSIGCIVEGTCRSYSTGANGERIDGVKLSILKNEWHDNVKKHLLDKIEKSRY